VKRLFWLMMGATIGVLVVRKLAKLADKLTPRAMAGGVGAGLADLADALRDFAADVRAAMRERETELRASTGLDAQLGKIDKVK
jgi:hypothetical protein